MFLYKNVTLYQEVKDYWGQLVTKFKEEVCQKD